MSIQSIINLQILDIVSLRVFKYAPISYSCEQKLRMFYALFTTAERLSMKK